MPIYFLAILFDFDFDFPVFVLVALFLFLFLDWSSNCPVFPGWLLSWLIPSGKQDAFSLNHTSSTSWIQFRGPLSVFDPTSYSEKAHQVSFVCVCLEKPLKGGRSRPLLKLCAHLVRYLALQFSLKYIKLYFWYFASSTCIFLSIHGENLEVSLHIRNKLLEVFAFLTAVAGRHFYSLLEEETRLLWC